MRSRRHNNRFWQSWQDEQTPGDDKAETDSDPRTAWRRHFAGFLGMAPEEHWLFGGRRFKPWASGEWGPPGLFNPFVGLLLSKGGGLLTLYVMHLLAAKPRYGNDIMREIEDRTRRSWGSNPGAVYPMLAAMEEAGLVVGEWADPDKRTRRMYRLTAQGRDEFERIKEVMRPKLEEAIKVFHDLYDDMEKDEEV